jgi:hypothetical protein
VAILVSNFIKLWLAEILRMIELTMEYQVVHPFSQFGHKDSLHSTSSFAKRARDLRVVDRQL